VLARAANLLTGRAPFETAKRMYPGDVIEPSPNSSPSLPATPRRHVLPKDLPGAIKQLDDQELARLVAAVLGEQKRRARKLAVSVETPDKSRIDAAALHLTPGKRNAVRAAFKAGVKPSQIARQSACLRPMCGRHWRAIQRGECRTATPTQPWPDAGSRPGRGRHQVWKDQTRCFRSGKKLGSAARINAGDIRPDPARAGG
jgi:hypothetical protein